LKSGSAASTKRNLLFYLNYLSYMNLFKEDGQWFIYFLRTNCYLHFNIYIYTKFLFYFNFTFL